MGQSHVIDIRPDLAADAWDDLDGAIILTVERAGVIRATTRVPGFVMIVLRDDETGDTYLTAIDLATAVQAVALLAPPSLSTLDGGR